ncbi:sulfotransferase [Alkalihalobacillus sp. BA299]|uniref:sulfotransferase family protein n=1 Tax=Alkalihalobacillus sp. BA299 TaxID=2815938 RepID=UPI001ADA3EE2|nr:sulfotransferase [Alkalihalobacillus sp. BA299]
MVLPNFLIIGAQKCGTTWLYNMLNQHPNIFLPNKKELEYFSYSKNNQEDINNYKEMFTSSNGQKAIGEATPSYFWNADAYLKWNNKPDGFENNIPKEVYKALGSSTKFILLLRNPIERAISAYLHHCKKRRISLRSDILEVGRHHGIIHMGFYYEHLLKWYEYFKPENFLIIIFETDFINDKKQLLENTFNFLKVDNQFIPKNYNKEIHKGMHRLKVNNNYYLSSKNKEVDLSDNNKLLFINEDTRTQLYEIYRKDIKKLSQLINKDLESLWK